ncbi:DUF3859 domain-containing protein [Vannielia sp.]|uniref:DUF3859 domain-containing protein n=1 Tax=Vannielia sp. TaxID=2813045 RepID=UPI00260EBF12|nr:DUF3859 domain-containing protein [Vannielia sp.]MDF1872153.1 DUF3859 domain-containing protein [Vannielia sp.]
MRILLGAVLAVVALVAPLAAQETSSDIQVNQALIAEITVGLNCKVEIVGSREAPGTERGSVDVFDKAPELSPLGTVVPALPGLGFGVRARAADGLTIAGATFRVIHPPFTESGTTEQSWSANYTDDGFSTHLYRFDYPHEMVTGTWVMEATHAGAVLYRVNFTVIPAKDFPGAETLCDPASLLSGDLAGPPRG